MRRTRAELRQRRRRRVRRGARRRRHRPARGPGDAHPGRVLLRGGRQPAPRRSPGRARAHARGPRRLLQAVGEDLGVPGAAQGPTHRGRPGARQGLRRGRGADGVERVRTPGLRRRRAGHAAARRGERAPRPPVPGDQARPGWAPRRGVRGAAAPARARAHRRGAAFGVDARRAAGVVRRRLRRPRRRREPRGFLPLPAPARTPDAAAAPASHPPAARPRRHRRAALARPLGEVAPGRPQRRRRRAHGGVGPQRPPGAAAAREAVLPAAAHRGVAAVGRHGTAVGEGGRRPARGAGLDVGGGRAGAPARAHRRVLPRRGDPADPAARAARRARPQPRPRPRPPGLPAGVRGARRHPVVPAAAAGRGAGRAAAHAAARHLGAGAGPARAGAGGAAAARRAHGRARRRAAARPGRLRRLAAAHRRAPDRPGRRGRDGPLAAAPRAAARRVRGPARHAVAAAGVRRAVLGVGRGARGHAGIGAAVAGRSATAGGPRGWP